MIDRDHKLPLARQAKAVGISRGSIYYRPRPVGEAGLGLMRRIDELHLEYPFAGSRMMRGLLRQEGLSSGRRHIATLMRRMGIEALYRKPNTSRRRPGHTVYPYLLRGLEVSRPNQVWAMDITYIPMARGFVYLAAVMDWHSRKVLAWRVSVTMDMAHAAIDAGADLVMGHGPHVIQGAEVYKGKAAFYSLGNFHFGSEAVEQDWVGMMLRAKVDDGRIVEVSCHPVRPNAERQTVVRSIEDEREVMRIFEEHSRRFGATAGFSDGAIVG